MPKNNLYFNPKYYEIAFSFRDIKNEVDVFEKAIKSFSKRKVADVLELGSGTSPHMNELCRRGYRYHGLDRSPAMLKYAEANARGGPRPKLYEGDISGFSLPTKVDFIYTALGSLYPHSTDDIKTHFDSVSRALRPGGLYFLDWCVQFDPWGDQEESWTTSSGKIKVRTTYTRKLVSPSEQLYSETIKLNVDDNGERKSFVWGETFREIYPQEFLLLVDKSKFLEFVGWWNNWDLSKPLGQEKRVTRPICVLRRI